eukprot:m.707834 g.707834  ORF g.707834 m.707834 type:complete len:512 (+) comp58736_c1_seq7:64-1599(+)
MRVTARIFHRSSLRPRSARQLNQPVFGHYFRSSLFCVIVFSSYYSAFLSVCVPGSSTEPAAAKTSSAKKARRADAADESAGIPFVFAMPQSVAQLQKLLRPHSPPDQAVVLTRILSCHNVHLKAQNRELLKGYFELVLAHCGQSLEQHDFAAVNNCTRVLYDITQQVPEQAGLAIRERLAQMHAIFLEKKAGVPFPPLSELFVFQVIGALFSTSDMYHAVVTPALILLAQLLSRCQLSDLASVVRGLFLVETTLKYIKESKRYIPEILNFLTGVLSLTAIRPALEGLKNILPHFQLLHHQANNLLDMETIKQSAASSFQPKPLPLSACDAGSTAHGIGCLELDIIATTLRLSATFSALYSRHAAYKSIAAGLVQQSQHLKSCGIKAVERLAKQLSAEEQAPAALHALRLQTHRPIPLPMLTPDFQETFSGRKSEPNGPAKEAKKLKREHKKEFKGAMRELRKDARYIAQHRLDDQKARDSVRHTKVTQLQSVLATQQGEINAELRAKNKKK